MYIYGHIYWCSSFRYVNLFIKNNTPKIEYEFRVREPQSINGPLLPKNPYTVYPVDKEHYLFLYFSVQTQLVIYLFLIFYAS
jgi:hypothetical protein